MGSLLRSEEMSLCQLFLQSEAAYLCVAELGELGLVQFRDLNPDVNAFQRKFVLEVRRCDEMERKLRVLEKEIKKDEIPMSEMGDIPDAPLPREMIELETTFEKLENELKEVNSNAEALKKTYLELTELKHILQKTQQFFDEIQESGMGDESTQLLGEEGLRAGGQAHMKLGFLAGVILRERLPAFERMLWRVCLGNVFLRQAEIEKPLEDPVSGDQVYKSVFIIFFQGEQLKTRVKKICEGFRATLYPCPETAVDRREMIAGVVTRIDELNTVLKQTTEHRHRVLVAAAKHIKNWIVKVKKVKAIYLTLNMFNLDLTRKCLIAECWCPVDDMERIHIALRRGTERSGSSVPSILNRMDTKEIPPTFNRTNKFTQGFQNLVNAYGVAAYREINPAPFTIITFPFLFAVMFGDAGHGLLMALFALWLVLKEQSLAEKVKSNEIYKTFFGGRYLILLMGIFSIYTGLIYNDVFSKSLNLFGSSWKASPVPSSGLYPETFMLDPQKQFTGKPYWFGMDPVWAVSGNKILFLNSYKMKLSVLLGVGQMLFGIVLSFYNHRYFGDRINILCEFIPQVIFLLSIFGYLNLLILAKWITYDSTQSGCAPSILITLINMFLYKYQDTPCSLAPMYSGQQFIQTVLLFTALACIPWMLIFKPYFLKKRHDAQKLASIHSSNTENHNGYNAEGDVAVSIETDAPSAGGGGGHGHDGEFDLGDVIIHQIIHTIESCLGSISHTASYLRLWALSLAHAQLSEVLWTMVLQIGLSGAKITGGFTMFVIFCFWGCLTVAVLLLMEGLSAFLHALRLHWVEFQSKFYKGDGYIFQPFSFEVILNNESEEVA
ncbi:V-type proton ATPase 116 kDa subunit a 1-like isoform X2 [Panonychus citri]|uniref:V-type proton ATPase 116 kDa subunit a 1-like isoform X2 n=1 Tax=Panonychus citri TaxID=50023 RepID=UPI0023077293|nr:V-type proton ATPase 116 kDa subunit a 1-like isoform X2 [Panonychus citri]